MTQPELFEDFHATSVATPRRGMTPVFVARRLTVTFTAQQLALVSAGAIVVLVALFALGVERGKAVGRMSSRPSRAAEIAVTPAVTSTRPAVSEPTPAPTTVATPATPAHPYTIQLATYTNASIAQRELEKLKAQGYTAFLMEGHNRVALCVGRFASRRAASQQVASFKKTYQDCFVRKR